MLAWIARGLAQGRITTRYPRGAEPPPPGYHGPVAVLDSQRADPALAQLCPTGAIGVDGSGGLRLDRGRCIQCGECVRGAHHVAGGGATHHEIEARAPQRSFVARL